MEYVNRQLLLDKRPTGMPEDNCWKMNEEKISREVRNGKIFIIKGVYEKTTDDNHFGRYD